MTALKNTSKIRVYRLKIGELLKTMLGVRNRSRAYRRDLEDAIVETHGNVSVTHAHCIDLAVQGETMSAIAQWLFRYKLETMSATDILACSQSMTRGKEIRNKAVAQLGLDPSPSEQIDKQIAALYSQSWPDEPDGGGA